MLLKANEILLNKLKGESFKYFINNDQSVVFIPQIPSDFDTLGCEEIKIKGKSILTSKLFQETREVKLLDGNVIDFDDLLLIGGPCSIKDESSLIDVAKKVKDSGLKFFRAGAYKPRTSPHDFQGHEEKGLEMLKRVKEKFGLYIVSEIMDASDISKFEGIVDVFQVGARNQQNFTLLKALGNTQTPILLKRGMSATMEEFILGAEYIIASGNPNVILCERGIRTFETKTRNTLDISVVSVVKHETNLPIIVDPSHAVGFRHLVKDASLGAIAAGCDGLIIEADVVPELTNTDIDQTISIEELTEICNKVKKIKEFI